MLLVFERSARRRHVETYWKQDHGRKTIKMEEKIAFRHQTGTVCFNMSLGYKVKKRPITKTIRLFQPASTSRLLYVVTSSRCFYQSSSQNAEGWKGRGKVAIYCMRSRCSKIHKDSGPPIRGPGAMGWGPSRQTGNLVKHCAFPRGRQCRAQHYPCCASRKTHRSFRDILCICIAQGSLPHCLPAKSDWPFLLLDCLLLSLHPSEAPPDKHMSPEAGAEMSISHCWYWPHQYHWKHRKSFPSP